MMSLLPIFHEGSADLPRSSQFVVVRVKFLIEVGESSDLGRIG